MTMAMARTPMTSTTKKDEEDDDEDDTEDNDDICNNGDEDGTRMAHQEQAKEMDTVLYDKEQGPGVINDSWAVLKFFFSLFDFLSLVQVSMHY